MKIYKTGIVNFNRKFKISFGGTITEIKGKFEEIICHLPINIVKEIQKNWKDYSYDIDNDGDLIERNK